MKDTRNKRAVIVGLFVFVGIIFLIIGILMIGNLNETFKRKIEVVTVFDDVSGLQKGNNIWFSGVKIGIIKNLEFYGERKVKVIMNIDEKAVPYIHKDAFVKLSTDGLIGNKILVIYGGSSITPEIEEGDTLGVEKTFTSDDMINTLQENNKNLLAITTDFKTISSKLANGEGTVGKLLNDDAVYAQLNAATLSLQKASARAEELIGSLVTFSEGLNKKGTLANEITTDTVVFNSLKTTVLQLQQMADTAGVFINNLKAAGSNPETSIGMLLYDEESGARLKQIIINLETGTLKLNEDLEAAQHNFLLKGYFKKKDKEKKNAPPE
jgi:phospholipid/cholesterol/gamma-HCH transport system substrate-binding protein